ncbi:transporter substrate-binding domain-containing protein [Azospirillum picis]|uniref:ABC-type amino acid transport substrate-binding protein n=1 Tax=Azospirillum picis TaxID=488438 RepID=A0ABU0MH26_9PROT|nr:transporter substrate-binding domain-containing protein [Azospirillum picis]MBP2299008.1 ABC-type amino acid transport substrate-binding protein [Azospirillum picis]MDQ0532750.1 ABC-type amino acid transport substrate-binding protein [Azospirillum picis]
MAVLTRRGLLAGLAAGTFPLALPVRRAAARPLDEVMERGRLRVAVYRDFPPFSFRRDGRLVGIDVDLAGAIAGRLGVKLDCYEQIPGETVSDDLRVAVWRGSLFGGELADVMMHIPYDKRFGLMNPEAVLFAPYHHEVFALARDPQRVRQAMLATLPDEPIAVEVDSVPDFFLLGMQGGRLRSRIIHCPTPEAAIEKLTAGEAAAVLAPLSQMQAALGPRTADFPVTTVALPGMMTSDWNIGMATKENSRDLAYAIGDAVTALTDDGSLAAIFAQYGATHTPPPLVE